MLEESRRIFLQIESAKTKNTLNEKVRRKSAAAGTKVSLCVLSFVWMLFYISAFTDKIYCTFKFNLAESLLRRYLLLIYKLVERWRCQFCCHCWECCVLAEKIMYKLRNSCAKLRKSRTKLRMKFAGKFWIAVLDLKSIFSLVFCLLCTK